MSIKNNEIPRKLKQEILSQLRQEQDKFMQNVERKMEEHNNALEASIKKFEENKGFIEKILSNKYYFEKLENLDKISSKLNDGILAHEIRISKNISDINALRTKYDKIILDNLLLPGIIGPSCQFKNLSQYLKNNIYDMTRMKADNESIKNIGNELKIRHDTSSKNISDLINNSVTRSNQYTDSRLNDCIAVLENKLKEMNEKLMEIRMKSIQSQEKLQEDMDNFQKKFEEKMKIQDDKILNCNNMMEIINLRLPEEENIIKSIKKLKSKYHHIKEFLLEFTEAYQPNQNINNNNQSLQVRNRRNSMVMLSSQMAGMSDNNLEKIPLSPRKDIGLNSHIEENIAKKERNNLLSPLGRQRQSVNINLNYKFKSNQKSNIKLRLLNISENSSDDNEDKDKDESNRNKNLNIKRNLNNNKEKVNNNIDSKKNKNKSNRSNRLDKGSKNKNNIKTKNNRNESKTLKKENSNFNSFDSNSDSNDNNYSKEKDKVVDIKSKKRYHNKKNIERIMIQSKTISQQNKNTNTSNNNSKINNNSNALSLLIDNSNKNNISYNRFKNTFQTTSRNYNNQISNSQYSNLNSQTNNFYRTQQEEKKEIIKDFFSKYDKNSIQDNLNLIKNRGNLDLYNYSVSPPDKNHFLDTKNDEIYDPPISKELLFNKKNKQNGIFNSNIKISKIPKMKYDIKLTSGNGLETNNKKIGTLHNINNLGNNNFMNDKKTEYSNKFTNTYRGSLKMTSLNSSKKN